ncbi:DNA helicase, partial [Tanacetum coccineum]
MDFVRTHHNDIRSDHLSGLYDTIGKGDCYGISVGSNIILPTSFIGEPCYMYSHYLDALAICRLLGNPQFFITFTCNVNWHEIERYMAQYPELTPNDRHDVVCRVFKQKVKNLVKFLKEVETFGNVTGVLYTVEFQKRGMLHFHTLLWVDLKDKIENAEQIDRYISSELPDPEEDPIGNKIVLDMMMHGPCGTPNLIAPYMQK